MKKALLWAMLALSMQAGGEVVYMSPHGKVYHRTTQCTGLSRSSSLYVADRALAEEKGLRPCGWKKCWPKKKPTSLSWAKPLKEEAPE